MRTHFQTPCVGRQPSAEEQAQGAYAGVAGRLAPHLIAEREIQFTVSGSKPGSGLVGSAVMPCSTASYVSKNLSAFSCRPQPRRLRQCAPCVPAGG